MSELEEERDRVSRAIALLKALTRRELLGKALLPVWPVPSRGDAVWPRPAESVCQN